MLPYLAGSGSPKPNPNARGAIFGLTLSHGRGHVTRALLEGVACLLRSNLDTFRSAGRHAAEIRSFGGGSRSPLWNQIKADLCGLPVTTSTVSEPGCLGAAILAGVGSRVFATIEEGCRRFVRFREPLRPDPACAAVYERLYERFLRLGRALESLEGT
jgi:xylulokinase